MQRRDKGYCEVTLSVEILFNYIDMNPEKGLNYNHLETEQTHLP